jgi:hypothetical protein
MQQLATIASRSSTFALVLALVGCTQASPLATSPGEGTEANGIAMNGISLQGVQLNGISLQGPELTGPVLQGTSAVTLVAGWLDDEPIADLGVQASSFVGTVQSQALAGTDLVDARLVFGVPALDASGRDTQLQIDARIVDVEPIGTSDVLAHHLQVWSVSRGAWVDPCDNGGLGLIALAGGWDLQSGDPIYGSGVTLACRGDVLAKCVEWGYEPWGSTPLPDLHQSCTRMARADYCGDGTPMTVDGTMIDIYDSLHIQERATSWPVEAEWGPWGATCIGDGPKRFELAELAEPDCFAALEGLPSCGELVDRAQLANSYTD